MHSYSEIQQKIDGADNVFDVMRTLNNINKSATNQEMAAQKNKRTCHNWNKAKGSGDEKMGN